MTHPRLRTPLPPVRVKDSKQLSPSQRERIWQWIQSIPHFAYATASASHKTIDAINIRQANFRAMRRAIEKLRAKVGSRGIVVFVDGNDPVPGITLAQRAFVKGDARIFSIACASVIAKVTRDRMMMHMAKKYPAYAFDIHKGYATALHRALIHAHGLSPIHRKTFCTRIPRSPYLRPVSKSRTIRIHSPG